MSLSIFRLLSLQDHFKTLFSIPSTYIIFSLIGSNIPRLIYLSTCTCHPIITIVFFVSITANTDIYSTTVFTWRTGIVFYLKLIIDLPPTRMVSILFIIRCLIFNLIYCQNNLLSSDHFSGQIIHILSSVSIVETMDTWQTTVFTDQQVLLRCQIAILVLLLFPISRIIFRVSHPSIHHL